jgi:hypothetical protein
MRHAPAPHRTLRSCLDLYLDAEERMGRAPGVRGPLHDERL